MASDRRDGAFSGRLEIDELLLQALQFFAALLRTPGRRRHELSPRRRRVIFVWSDAMWDPSSPQPARLGWVVYAPPDEAHPSAPSGWFWSYYDVPEALLELFVRRASYIGQLEILAAVVVYFSWPDLFRDVYVVHFIDNTSAIAGLVKGYSWRPDSARLVHAFHAMNVGIMARVWFAHVRSAANVSDGPSRGDFDYVIHILGATYVATTFPPLELWLAPAGPWMAVAEAAEQP